MQVLDAEIRQLLETIPFFPEQEKQDFLATRLPNLTEEEKKKIWNELWGTFRELMANVPLSAFSNPDVPLEVQQKILEIEKIYLFELQQEEKNLKEAFFSAEKKLRAQELQQAEYLLQTHLS